MSGFDGLSLEQALGGIVDEAEHNAKAKPLGSQRDGVRRGVGFSSAAGYIEALRLGVKRRTAEEYKRTLVSTYRMPQAAVDALPVNLLREDP